MSNHALPVETLQQMPAFRGFNPSECHQLLDISREKSFAPGQKIIEQGKRSQYLWFVLEGQCQVVRDGGQDGPVILAELAPYSLFGEMSFFSPAPHSAHVVAKTPVKLLSIARADYDDMIRDGAIAAYKLAYNIVDSVAERLRRMDQWVTELSSSSDHPTAEKLPEWRRFREKLFNGWNL